ncbi:MAG: alpha/beta fold hydrolase [Marinobacter sp.]|uniref:alpha/beta fold hydrolase n=1 Tax=Marinobacter sp. TaxID=50741 RepID=UPI00299CF30F|nr:alpha/beta fold hydrolase [Marinobacter sp.]MDX1633553.1 alpha/beta fold hydrolase [Marinobacter sp.]
MPYTETFLASEDGHRIALRQWLPAEPESILVIAHGMAEHGARYQDLALWLNARGIAVYAADHRGHGPYCDESERGHFADRGGWARVVADLHRVVGHARAELPGLPLALMGHSMGSFIAQAYAQRHGECLDSLLLSATNRIPRARLGASKLLVAAIRMLKGRRHLSPLIDSLTFGAFNRTFRPNRTSHDWLSRDPDQVDRYLADPHCGFGCTTGLWYDFLDGMLGIDPKRWRRELPVHVMAGSADPVGEMGRGVIRHVAAIRAAGIAGRERLFEGGRHELVNETNREETWQYILDCQPMATRAPALSA